MLNVILYSTGITLEWDKGMRIYIKLDPIHMGKVCGLCGDYDGKADNDFRSRNDLIESTSLAFANSWKTSQSCPNHLGINVHPCVLHNERKHWAVHSCSILNGDHFVACHAVVNIFLLSH